MLSYASRLALAAGLTLAPITAAAQNQNSGNAVSADVKLEIVVVTATRIRTPLSQVASSITAIGAEEIDRKQERTLSDVLKNVPGLNLVQTGGPGGAASVFMRGTNSNHTKVLVDGIDVSDPTSSNGAFDFASLLAPDIQQVEVLRGPQSGLYGADAIGGVINVITKAGEGPFTVTGSIEGGSFSTFNQNLNASGSEGGFHYSLTGEHFHAGATPVTPLNLLSPGQQRNDDSYDNVTGSAKLGYDIAENLNAGFVARVTNTHLRYTGDDFSLYPVVAPASSQSRFNSQQYYTRATLHWLTLDGLLDNTFGVSYGSSKSSYYDPSGFPPESYFTGNRMKADWQGNVKVSETGTLILGAEYQKDRLKTPLGAEATLASGYVSWQASLDDAFFYTLSGRYDSHDNFGGKFTYRVAPAYLIRSTGTKLKASYGTGFKPPTLDELFHDYPAFFFYANPNLKPETSRGFDAGFEQEIGEDVRFGVTYFRNDIKNLITTDPLTFSTLVNLNQAKTDGLESFIAWRAADDLTLRFDHTFTEATDKATDLALVRRPKHKASLSGDWQAMDDLSFNVSLLYLSSWADSGRFGGRVKAPGATTVNLAANYTWSDSITLFGRVTNLFDEEWQNPTGFLQPGRGVYAGIKAAF